MRNLILLAISILVLSVGNACAQVAPDMLVFKKGHFTDGADKVYSDAELKQLIGKNVYHQTYVGASQQYKYGKILTIGGGIGSVAGYTVFFCAMPKDGERSVNPLFYVGGGVAIVSLLAVGGGVPLLIVGKSRLNWIANDYNDKHSKVSMNLTACPSGPGLGVSVKF